MAVDQSERNGDRPSTTISTPTLVSLPPYTPRVPTQPSERERRFMAEEKRRKRQKLGCRICWILLHGIVLGGCRADSVGLRILLFDALDLFMHGNFLGEDHEEGSLCGGEELRLEQAPLSLAVYSFGAVPTFYMAWQHNR